jgi:MYXO-CTERM domain-containing protein
VADAKSTDAGEGKVDLSVRAEGAKNVTARFQTGTGPVEVALTNRGSGLFGASVTAPGSWDAITFIAEDQAGNQGSATLEAPKDETPFVGPLAALALLGALAVAMRRRSA